MGRGVGSRRWIAASGGVLINGLMLAALVLIEEPPPLVEDQPPLLVELERPHRQRTPRARAASVASGTAARPAETPSEPSASAESGGDPVAPPAIDPRWRIDPKALDRWKLTEGAPEWGWGRAYRACKGLSSEHMTDEEKDRCYGGWSDGPRDKRPSPGFVGPVDQRKWEVPDPIPVPPSRYDQDAARQQRCRDERRRRVPGTLNEKHLDFEGGSPRPSLLEGGCF